MAGDQEPFLITDRAMRVGLSVTLLAFFALAFVGFEWPSASASLHNLRQAYPGQQVEIVTVKTTSLVDACGYYVLGGSSHQLKYSETKDGLAAERTPAQWLVFPVNRPYEDEWEACMGRSRRGRALDFIFDPIVAALLRLT